MALTQTETWPPQPCASADPPVLQTRSVRASGIALTVDVCGDPASPPALLLHGIPGWRGTWRDVARLLSPRAYVIAPDLAGFGESGSPPAAFHAAEHADLIVALIRQLGVPSVHLVGFDFGGPTAVLVCAKAPDLVASLTLAATNVLIDTPIPTLLRAVRTPFLGSLFSRLMFGRVGLTMMWFGAVARRERFSLSDYCAMLRFPQGIASTRRIFQTSLRDLPALYGPVQAALSCIRVPCVVIWGDRDPFFPVSVGEQTAARIPGATFTVLPGCGHFLPQEAPQAFAEIVSPALQRSQTAVADGSCHDGRDPT